MKGLLIAIAVLLVAFVVTAYFMHKEQEAWTADCVAQGGHVEDVSKTSTGFGVSGRGKPVTTTSTETTYFCLTEDGRILKVK